MTISQHKVVTIHYKVVDAHSGDLLESSEGGDPMIYLHGASNIIPGLEKALEGKSVGDELEITIAPEEAYGERQDEHIHQLPIESFEGVESIEPGMAFTAQTPQGPINLVVQDVTEEMVTVDANHPLAGKSLTFSVKIDSIRDASDEEKAHGHAHGPEGHNH
ncbi:FKBP-type peptidyl-prolyl cis-trans isomerase [Dongshaea marina]|uniref:FKBP-type peptidyl-prolyl cis-trans isomerase n=1 Tax=Dongshaea marina TaxID=2047966 RepID=UPI000D3EC5C5|nr:peptidylprolyl isomerase [Dongshaea marina]